MRELAAGLVLAWLTCSSARAQPDAAPRCGPPPACDGWCAETLVPGTAGHPRFAAVWSDAPDDVWAVGRRDDTGGFVFHWDGCAWKQSPAPATAGLEDVWGTGPDDVWAVGAQGVALHWTGSVWVSFRPGASATLNRVSGSGAGDVWAIGRAGLFHWNGRSWARDAGLAVDTHNEFLGDIWAVATDDVWVAEGFDARGSVAHFDGKTWRVAPASPDTAFGLFGIWSNGSTTWTVGEGNQVLRRSGGSWTQRRPPGGSAQGLVNVMGAGGEMYASGQTVVHATATGPVQTIAGLPAGSFPGLWVNGTQVWVAGSSNAGGAVVLHRAR